MVSNNNANKRIFDTDNALKGNYYSNLSKVLYKKYFNRIRMYLIFDIFE